MEVCYCTITGEYSAVLSPISGVLIEIKPRKNSLSDLAVRKTLHENAFLLLLFLHVSYRFF